MIVLFIIVILNGLILWCLLKAASDYDDKCLYDDYDKYIQSYGGKNEED